MRIIHYVVFPFLALMFLSLSVCTPAKGQVKSYINKYKPLATNLSEQYGIPVAIILGVAIVESSAGKGPAVKHLNNHFGIVGHNKQKTTKKKRKSRYKQYKSDEASFEDFCRVISRKKFYGKLKSNSDPKLWVDAIVKAHYSEAPLIWKKRVMYTIKKYHLESLQPE